MTASTRSTNPATARRAEATATVASGCVNPIRLRGFYQRICAHTGEVLALFGSPERPNGVLLVACKDRRASCCVACARRYEKDAYHLIAAGLRGGKSVPAVVGSHPAVMLTLTAPSFGAVHGNGPGGQPCQCGRHHQMDDHQLGAPIDPERYRYAEQVIWNHYAPELWKRTVQAIRRRLAQALGIPRSKLSHVAPVRFAKVAEFQRRGVVHYHAIIRIDGPDGLSGYPPVSCATSLLEEIVRAAATSSSVEAPIALLPELGPGSRRTLRWGSQREVDALDHETCTKAASYIAKYATKATEAATGGILVKPIRPRDDLEELQLTGHAKALIRAAWCIGERAGIVGLKRWAHQFGYGGHTLTKSREYSVTFAALRAARSDWRRSGEGGGDVVVRAQLVYAGRGYRHHRDLERSGDADQRGQRASGHIR